MSSENSEGEAVPQAAVQLVEASVFPAVFRNVLVPQILPLIVNAIVVVMPEKIIIHESQGFRSWIGCPRYGAADGFAVGGAEEAQRSRRNRAPQVW